MDVAKLAWLVSREQYDKIEVYRFRLSPIDSTNYADEDGPEGDINTQNIVGYHIFFDVCGIAVCDHGEILCSVILQVSYGIFQQQALKKIKVVE